MKRQVLVSSAAAFMLVTLVSPARGQEVQIRNDPSYPVQILYVSPSIAEGGTAVSGASVSVRNTGSVDCVAISVAVVVKYTNSLARHVMISTRDYSGLGYTYTSGGVPPGQVQDIPGAGTVTTPQGSTIANLEARVDYIEMADGTTYGNDPHNVRQQINMSRGAKRAERARLLKIYQETGIDALISELKRPVGPASGSCCGVASGERDRLLKTYQQKGPDALRGELQRSNQK
jgi:hypothetical protein